jgi:cytidine deaminase
MKRQNIGGVSAYIYTYDELSPEEQKLIRLAAKVRKNAQAPYSKYLVGAAVLDDRGRISVGCNVERCTLTQTTHAEQNAVDSMIARYGSRKIEAIAIVAGNSTIDFKFPPSLLGMGPKNIRSIPCPCGHCLQVIWENCFDNAGVRIYGIRFGYIIVTTIGTVFPARFGPSAIGVKI